MLFFGPPGAGKGTQAQKLSSRFNIPHIATGDMFREAISKQTPAGLKAKDFIEKGLLVPDDIVIEVVKERINQPDCKKGFILDGFPRTVAQAEALEKIAPGIDAVIYFNCKQDEIVARLSGRRVCKNCGANFHIKNIPPRRQGICDYCDGELYQRADDTPDAIRQRLQVYYNQTSPVLEYYRRRGVLFEIDASLPAEDVYKKVEELISTL